MNKQFFFIKITNDYWAPKNKLQKLLKEKIKELDNLLVDSKSLAKKLIKEAANLAHDQCTSNCKKINSNEMINNNTIYIRYYGVIHIAIYPVKIYKNQ